jgi:hypothetical protein
MREADIRHWWLQCAYVAGVCSATCGLLLYGFLGAHNRLKRLRGIRDAQRAQTEGEL